MRPRRLLLAVAVLAVACALAAAPAYGASGAYLRLAHLSPDTPNVDVYVASVGKPGPPLVVSGVGYGAVSGYRLIEPGDYTISMRPSGASADTPPMLTTTLSARGGSAYTVAGVGMFAQVGLKILDDDLTLPPAGQARVRVIHAAATAQAVDVAADGGATIATGVGFSQTTGYQSTAAGTWTLRVTPAGKPAVVLPCDLAANSVYTVLLVDKGGTLAAELRTDARAGGSGPIPTGAIQTGLGGTAPDGSGSGTSGSGAPEAPVAPGLAAAMMLLAGTLSGLLVGSLRRRTAAR